MLQNAFCLLIEKLLCFTPYSSASWACLTLMNYFNNNIKWSDKAILRTKKKRILMPCHANKTVTNCVLVHGTCFYITVFDHCTFFVSCNSFFSAQRTRNNAPSLILDHSLSFWHIWYTPGLHTLFKLVFLYTTSGLYKWLGLIIAI